MSLLDIISPNAALRHVIREQIETTQAGKEAGLVSREISFLAEAKDIWTDNAPNAAIIDDNSFEKETENLDILSVLYKTADFVFILTGTEERKYGTAEVFRKPVRMGHLISRYKFLSNLKIKDESLEIEIGPWFFSQKKRELKSVVSKEIVRLTKKETDLLAFLCLAKNPISRDEILASIWGYDSGIDTHTLETHITNLRRKLKAADDYRPEGEIIIAEKGCYFINQMWLER